MLSAEWNFLYNFLLIVICVEDKRLATSRGIKSNKMLSEKFPNFFDVNSMIVCRMFNKSAVLFTTHVVNKMGRKGVEPSTFRLSVERSTKLSYRPNLAHTSAGALFQRQFKYFFLVHLIYYCGTAHRFQYFC